MTSEHTEHAEHPSPAPARGSHARPAGWHARPLVIGLVVGLGGVLVAAAVLLIAMRADAAPRLTRAAYEEAARRWDANGPASYDLDVELGGRRPGNVHVEVRDGEVTRMLRDGVEPRQRRTWYYWSVPGQLDTIEQELDMAADPAGSYGVPGAHDVALWAEFDPKYGYPRRFDRVVMGADVEVHWRVTRFVPLEGKK